MLAQNKSKVEKDSSGIYIVSEQYPDFPGGMSAMMEFINSNIRVPQVISEQGIKRTSFLKFVITIEGKIRDIIVLRGSKDCSECDNEAIRLVSIMPDWIPGKLNGENVNAYFNLPISFRPITH